jgi:hypothetical protein
MELQAPAAYRTNNNWYQLERRLGDARAGIETLEK